MTLDEIIAQMTNPQEFTRLCNAIFTDIYGHNFQVIDGSRADEGNDGYVDGERRMLAIHCPVKPEQKTDAGYIEKIKGDLAKAAKLKSTHKYAVESWTFITPRKLGNGVIVTMRALALEVGMRASHQESTFLANELYRRGHLLKGFPNLQQVDLAAKIDELMRVLTAREAAPADGSLSRRPPQPAIDDKVGDARFTRIIGGTPSQEGKLELKAMAYQTTDPILEINAILALFQWFDPSDDDRAELMVLADRGIDRAKRIGQRSAEALFRAQKAALLVWDFNTLLIEVHYAGALNFLVPFATTPIEQSQGRLTRLRRLEDSWRAETAAAVELTKGTQDLESVGNVLVVIGTNMGQLALANRQLGRTEPANRYLANCKTLLLAAKDAYSTVGDELGATNAIFNLANQIRWHDDAKGALLLVKQILPIAERYGDLVLQQKARWLQHTLETGEIPDYAAGQRRTWTAVPPTKNEN